VDFGPDPIERGDGLERLVGDTGDFGDGALAGGAVDVRSRRPASGRLCPRAPDIVCSRRPEGRS